MDKVRDWCNKYIKHDRDDVGDFGWRLVMHACLFPLVTACLLVDPVGGAIVLVAFTYTFNKYQRNEDLHNADEAWKDQSGYMWAIAIGVVIYLIIVGFHEY